MSEQRALEAGTARVYFRRARSGDRGEFTNLMAGSRSLHHPWITPPTTAAAFNQYLTRIARDDHEGFLICRYADDSIVGAINLNNIVRGTFLSATLGYYVGAPYVGSGYMSEGLELIKAYAFETMKLHRLEANIQPDNERSLNLVRRCGFSFEGLAPRFLFIAGAWRDHERWTCLDGRDALYPIDTFG